MYNPKPILATMALWQQGAVAYTQMWFAASEVIWRRSIDMALGTQSVVETTRMFVEKPTAFATAFEKAALAGAAGKGIAGSTLAAIKPVKRKAVSNAKRLRRRKSRK